MYSRLMAAESPARARASSSPMSSVSSTMGERKAEWPRCAGNDEAGPVERVVERRLAAHQGELGAPQRLDTVFTAHESSVVVGHQVTRRLVIDLPQADHLALRPGHGQRAAQAVNAL